MPNVNSAGIACGLQEPVTKGTKLEDAIVTPKATYIAADGYGKNVREALQKVATKKPKRMQHVVVKSEKDLDQLLASHPTLAALPSDAQARKTNRQAVAEESEVRICDDGLRRVAQRSQSEKAFPMACKSVEDE